MTNGLTPTDQIIEPIGDETFKSGTADCEVIIGDENEKTFKPNVEFRKLNKEFLFGLELQDMGILAPQLGNKLEYIMPGMKIEYYPEGEDKFEQNIILLTKPVTTGKGYTFVFAIHHNGVIFDYQPKTLTPFEISLGAVRPDNVKGSYTLYMPKEGNQYGCGKFGHLFNDYCIDDAGKIEYPVMSIVGNFLYITISQKFIDTAKYPIRNSAGLLFEWSGVPGTPVEAADTIWATIAAGVAGTGDSIKVYCKQFHGWIAEIPVKGNVYKGADSTELHPSCETEAKNIPFSNDPAWLELPFVSTPTFIAEEYKIAFNANDWWGLKGTFYYDVAGALKGELAGYPGWLVNAPWDFSFGLRFGIYVDGTPAPTFIPRTIPSSHIAKSMNTDFISKHDLNIISKSSSLDFVSKIQKNFVSKTKEEDFVSKHNE
jgi:hypothetical protein